MGGDQLVIIQPTPFCNIACTYCYLPDRNNTARASLKVLGEIFQQTLSSTIIKEPITYVWHAGEPLSLPSLYYRDAFLLAQSINCSIKRTYKHSIQTNAILIDDAYLKLFKDFEVDLGVSLDGPDFIHDRQRRTRSGKGTHHDVMRGISRLQGAGIPFGVIAVLTRYSLDFPDEIFDFFINNGISQIAFNIDEIEGMNTTSSHQCPESRLAYLAFMRRFLLLSKTNPGKLVVREFRQLYEQLMRRDEPSDNILNSTNSPMRVLSFDYRGNYWTFSPELNGASSERFGGPLIMGNVFTQDISSIERNPVYQAVAAEVAKGVKMCRDSCEYWRVCGGGSPAAKFFEYGRFDVTETATCRIVV